MYQHGESRHCLAGCHTMCPGRKELFHFGQSHDDFPYLFQVQFQGCSDVGRMLQQQKKMDSKPTLISLQFRFGFKQGEAGLGSRMNWKDGSKE